MREFQLRDLETGKVIIRNGADRREILKRCAPGKSPTHAGYCDLGYEPKGWKPPPGTPTLAQGREMAKRGVPQPPERPGVTAEEFEE